MHRNDNGTGNEPKTQVRYKLGQLMYLLQQVRHLQANNGGVNKEAEALLEQAKDACLLAGATSRCGKTAIVTAVLDEGIAAASQAVSLLQDRPETDSK